MKKLFLSLLLLASYVHNTLGSAGSASAATAVALSTTKAQNVATGDDAEEKELLERIRSIADFFGENFTQEFAKVKGEHIESNKLSPDGSGANNVHIIARDFGFALSGALAVSQGNAISTQAELNILKRMVFCLAAQQEKMAADQKEQQKKLDKVLLTIPQKQVLLQDKKRRKSF